jgi:hypothetical protein
LVELVGGTGQWRMAEILGYAVLADQLGLDVFVVSQPRD